jgi:hypothetical protein
MKPSESEGLKPPATSMEAILSSYRDKGDSRPSMTTLPLYNLTEKEKVGQGFLSNETIHRDSE